MKKLIYSSLLLATFFIFSYRTAYAADQGSCSEALFGGQSNVVVSGFPTSISTNYQGEYNVNLSGLRPDTRYDLSCQTEFCQDLTGWFCEWRDNRFIGPLITDSNGRATSNVDVTNCWINPDRKHRLILNYDGGTSSTDYCSLNEYTVTNESESFTCDASTFQAYSAVTTDSLQQGCFEIGDTVTFHVQINGPNGIAANRQFYYRVAGVHMGDRRSPVTSNADGYIQSSIQTDATAVGGTPYFEPGDSLRITVISESGGGMDDFIIPGCENLVVPLVLRAPGQCTEEEREQEPPDSGEYSAPTFSLCGQLDPESSAYVACQQCRNLTGNKGIWTAVGCFSGEPTQIVGTLVRLGLNIGGGIALIMILVASFMFSTSQGDPNKVKEAKELMASAVIGLIFIIFSVTILQFIGSSLLKIPGFSDQ